jgi:ABC-2 type transport system ATP-binding protein
MKKLISIDHLNYSIPYGQKILEDINFSLSEGQFLGILGRNGVGKTTLMDLLLGARPKTSGSILVLDEDPMSLDRKNMTGICFLSQDISLKGNLTIDEFLKFYSSLYPKYSLKEETNLLEYFSLNRLDKVGSLSTGQQKKVQIVAGLSAMPEILLIDEITAVLDPETRSQFFLVLNRFKSDHGLGIILATNIAEDLIARADEVLFIENHRGAIKKPSEILNLFKIKKAS